ncbi:hypothetical protein [Ponticoccus sp. (in: a-proteobacteria)]
MDMDFIAELLTVTPGWQAQAEAARLWCAMAPAQLARAEAQVAGALQG